MNSSAISGILITIVNLLFELAFWAILARVLLSWLPMLGVRIDPYNPIIRILHQVTDPILEPLRKVTTFGMMDFSPIVAMLLLQFIKYFLIKVLGG